MRSPIGGGFSGSSNNIMRSANKPKMTSDLWSRTSAMQDSLLNSPPPNATPNYGPPINETPFIDHASAAGAGMSRSSGGVQSSSLSAMFSPTSNRFVQSYHHLLHY